MFYFSKKVPSGISTEKTENASKALYSLLIMTGLLIVMFVPVFNSYKTDPSTLTAEEVHDLETYRMKWLFGALAVVVISLLVSNLSAKKNPNGWGAMKYPQLVLGMLALFVYVGVEVTIVSNLSELLKQPDFGGYQSSDAAPFIAMYWGSLMIGRWTGSISVFNLKSSTRQAMMVVVPLVAFGIIIGVISISQYDVKPLLYYVLLVIVQIIAFFLSKDRPARTLLLFSLLGLTGMLVGIFSTGSIAVYAFMSGGLFCSIMWPAIFNLSILGLGKYTTQGSAFLIMMILGGGIIPPIQGKLADYIQTSSDVAGYGIHNSYWVAVLCFAYLAFFAFFVRSVLRKQGIDSEAVADENLTPLETFPEGPLDVIENKNDKR